MNPDHRQYIRQLIRQRRRELSEQQQQQAALSVCQRIQRHPKVLDAQSIALFLSFDGELNTQPLIEWCWQQGKAVYLPVLHPFSPGNLLFLRYGADTCLIPHPFGLSQPALDVRQVIPVAELDIIFTPLVAFDRNGHRLGMGGGYYDRTLQQWQKMDVYPIGLAHDCQQVEELEKQDWDIPLPEIITPSADWLWA